MKGMDAFTENVKCPKCESPHVVKAGTRNGHQRYLCRACSKKFPANGKAAGRRIRADRMGEAIRLFYAGMSYKQIAENLEETYDVPALSTATIYQWVRDYTKDALKEMEGHKAHAGGRWLVDEMQLRVGGREYWVWNVMDESTRYLLASQLTKERDARAAESVLRKAAGAAVKPAQSSHHRPGGLLRTRGGEGPSRSQALPVAVGDEPGEQPISARGSTGQVRAALQGPAEAEQQGKRTTLP